MSNRTGRNQIYKQQLGKDSAELVIQSSDDESLPVETPDGLWILYWSQTHTVNPATVRLMRFPWQEERPSNCLKNRLKTSVLSIARYIVRDAA